jgi:hypothetical protein
MFRIPPVVRVRIARPANTRARTRCRTASRTRPVALRDAEILDGHDYGFSSFNADLDVGF